MKVDVKVAAVFEVVFQLIYGLLVLALGLFFGGLGIAAIGGAVRRRRMARASRGWRSTSGRVLEATVEKSPGGRHGPHYEPLVRYQYEVGGQRYVGTRISFGDISGRVESQQTVKRYPRDTAVTVLYDPANPEAATLEASYPGSNQLWHVFMGCALILAPGGLCSWIGGSMLAETIGKMLAS